MRAVAPIVLIALALAASPARAEVSAGSYTRCEPVGEASIVEVSAGTCGEASAIAIKLVAAPADAATAILDASGWTALRALSTKDERGHDLVATRGLAALRIRRLGPAPDLDGWAAGRELLFARGPLVGGRPVPGGASLCTAGFLVRLASGRAGGLSAAHCGGVRRDGTIHRRNVALRRPPQPGIVLGRVRRNVARSSPLDALLLPVPAAVNRSAVAVVDRGVARPPWSVAGFARPLARRAVCMTGRTSGADRCGQIVDRRARRGEALLSVLAGVLVRCTTISASEGDSGGPVYTAPRADGTVRAIGIATLVVGDAKRMCFTPLGPVLDALDAELVTTAAG